MALTGLAGLASAKSALIVDDGTALVLGSEAILSARLVNAGYTVTTNNGIPSGSLSGYAQAWDLRFVTALTGGEITSWMTYLTGGGSLFLLGENQAFLTRDNSFIPLFTAAGGGAVSISQTAGSIDAQTVRAPFTGPVSFPSMTYAAAGAYTAFGNARLITVDANGAAAGIVFPPGSLTNAPTGTLLSVLDYNFLTAGNGNSQALTDNLISYLGAPTAIAPLSGAPAPAPTTGAVGAPALGEWGLIGLTGLLLAFGALQLKRNSQAS